MLKRFNIISKNAYNHNIEIVSRTYIATSIDLKLKQYKIFRDCKLLSVFGTCGNTHTKRFIYNTDNTSNLHRSDNVHSKYKEMEANLKWRADPVITTLDTPQFKSILRKNILDLVSIFEKYNHEIRIAGGAVRLE